jgi:type IV secretory pathway TrbF-like protein
MSNPSDKDYHPSPIEQASKRHWNEYTSYHRLSSLRSFLIALVSIIFAFAAVVHSWYSDSKPKFLPYVIDRNGPSVLTAKLEATVPDARRIKEHLADWTRAMRTVTIDPKAQTRAIRQAFAWVDEDTIGKQQLSDWYSANDPRVRATKGIVDVDVNSVVLEDGNTWLIDWTETAYNLKPGQVEIKSHWRMSVVIRIQSADTEEQFESNWSGIFIEQFHLQDLDHST